MKFLKEDGTVEDGTPLTNTAAALIEKLEEYFHVLICKHAYHGHYDTPGCKEAARVLGINIVDLTEEDLLCCISNLVDDRKPKPRVPEPIPAVEEPQPDAEKEMPF